MEAERRLTQWNAGENEAGALLDLGRARVSVELLAYLGLALLALVLRLSALGGVAISESEAEAALHAWRVIEDDAPGAFSISPSPMTHISQIIAFSALGANEFTARAGAAIAGFMLALSPLLFRDSLGRTRAFVWAALLALLTTPLASSRIADGASFMMLFTLLAICLIRRYWYSLLPRHAILALGCISAMLLLSSPSGLPLFVILLLAGWLAVWRTALSAPQRLDLPGDDILQLALKRLREFPFEKALIVPPLTVGLVATMLMLHPGGLKTVSQLLGEALRGMSESHGADGLPAGFAVLLFQEPLLIVYAMGGAWLLWKKGDVTYLDRFAAAWAALGALGLLLYPGARPGDAMWVALPLTLLASYGITQLMVNRRVVLLWEADDDEAAPYEGELYSTRYWWVKWAISAGVFMFLLMLSVQFIDLSRLTLGLPAGAGLGEIVAALSDGTQLRFFEAASLLALTVIIGLAVFLLLANFWGMGACLQGLGLGFLWLLPLSGLGGAWTSTAITGAGPDGLWRSAVIADDAYLLRETLFELADRQTQGLPLLEFTIVAEPGGPVSDHGALAWLVRDFPKARFVRSMAEARGHPIVLTPHDEAASPDLGGDYVGQRFGWRRSWSLAGLQLRDLPAWWSHGHVRAEYMREAALTLWLRQDVYDGVLANSRS